MRLSAYVLAIAVAAGVAAPVRAGGQMPPGMTHEEHLKQMQKDAEAKKRGAAAMGFDQDATVHHFRLFDDGGAIDVEVKSEKDRMTRDAVRLHLRGISDQFAAGNFDKPFSTHGETPAGVPDMIRLRGAISYAFEETPKGGRVRIRTSNAEALRAVHAFLEYQIREHHTGD